MKLKDFFENINVAVNNYQIVLKMLKSYAINDISIKIMEEMI